jgi:tRNA dimethylallyltransferase
MTLLVLTGPTGTGKSDWAARLADEFPLEIVSVDSALVYRGMDIGTAKPSAELRARIPHHLIDICDPREGYSAGRFVADATACISEIRSRGRVPFLVGGTMLYLRALIRGMAVLPQASPDIRARIEERAAAEGWDSLHRELAGLDPEAAARIHPNDPQRIERALEVCYATGKPISLLQRETQSPLADERLVSWALIPADRGAFRERLAHRFGEMMRSGFLAEVRALHQRGDLSSADSAIRAVGYRQLWGHLDGQYDLERATALAITATRQLARRQLTWLRAEPGSRHLDPLADDAFVTLRREVQTVMTELKR